MPATQRNCPTSQESQVIIFVNTMENLNNCDNPGDCQTKARSPRVGNENNSPSRAHTTVVEEGVNVGKSPTSSLSSVATMPLASNKLKTQEQQPPPHQHHQFRAPQQFVKHKKVSSLSASSTSSMHAVAKTATANASSLTNNTNKKNKCWNKRQNRTAKQNTVTSTISNNTHSASNESFLTTVALAPTNPSFNCGGIAEDNHQGSTKADVENIQNLKNQVGGHNYYHHYQQQQLQLTGNGGASSVTNDMRLSLSITSEKLAYGHGHLKVPQQQQLHKKPLPSHRGGGGGGGGGHNQNHHHVLCAGSAHNTIGNNNNGGGGGGGNGGGGSVANNINSNNINSNNMSCCHINGCGSHMGKDSQSIGGGNTSNPSNSSSTLHFCCLRSKFFLPDKRPRKGNFIPPTKFLLGGNISDPLNLSSLQNEASNTSSNTTPATTPRQSPITTPPKVEVIIPPNIHDPLHLLDPVDSMEYEKQLTSPMKRGLLGLPAVGVGTGLILGLRGQTKAHKHRHRKNRKPKRKRYDSCNSTASSSIMGDTVDDLMASGPTNTSTSTEKVTLVSAEVDNKCQLVDNECGNSIGGAAPVDDEEISERNLSSPQQLSFSNNTDTLKVETKPSSPPAQDPTVTVDSSSIGCTISTGVGSNVATTVAVTTGEAKERACRDLRLDLVSTTTGSNSCGSSVVSGSGVVSGGRKRKISESNNSLKSKKYFRNDSMDKIVSPVVPQPGAWKRPPRTTASGSRKANSRRSTSISENNNTDLSPMEENANLLVEEIPRDDTPDLMKVESTSEMGLLGSPLSTTSATTTINAGETEASANLTTASANVSNAFILAEEVKKVISSLTAAKAFQPKLAADGAKYRYGNYDRYPGLRHLNEFMDIRLQVFLQHPELFKNKDILDVGCNVGHMTISVARKLAPKTILGIDIDKELVSRARRNLAMYVRIPREVSKKENAELDDIKDSEDIKVSTGRRRRRKKKLQLENQPGINTANIWHQFQHHQPMHFHNLHSHHHHHTHYHHYHHQQHHHHSITKMQHSVNPNLDAAECFPISFPLTYGGITQPTTKAASPQNLESQSPVSTSTTTRSTPGHPPVSGKKTNQHNPTSTTVKYFGGKAKNDFPHNVFFRQTNYVLKDENMMAIDTQQYDLILCLSVTKWIHLNFGDAGLKAAFKRIFNQLRPGGKLILEAQNWASYKKKKNLTEDIYNNYHSIEFFPNKFHEYLLSSEVGFSHSYTLGVPKHLSKGFSRPIQLYAKGDYTPNHVRWSDAYYPQTPFEAYRGIYATMPPRPTGMQSSYPLISSSRSQNYDTPQYTGGGGASGPYSCRQTPMHQPSTSQYYNPLESDSYQPSYDMEYLNHMYVFASPLYQTVWSPPTSMRKSSSHTPIFGSVRDPEFEGDSNNMPGGSYHRHVYPPNDEISSPNANASNAFNSIRDPDTDDSNQQRPHVYATNCESSSSPHTHNLNANESDTTLEENLMMDEESRNNCVD